MRPAVTLQIHQLTTLLRAAKFPAPSDKCLSPAGEYNLRLGIMKELEPQVVATTCGKPFGFEGHPFIVEAAVSLGGKLGREGITVHRFANRIPLLFEAGGDVVTKTAQAIGCVEALVTPHLATRLRRWKRAAAAAPTRSCQRVPLHARFGVPTGGRTTRLTKRRSASACL